MLNIFSLLVIFSPDVSFAETCYYVKVPAQSGQIHNFSRLGTQHLKVHVVSGYAYDDEKPCDTNKAFDVSVDAQGIFNIPAFNVRTSSNAEYTWTSISIGGTGEASDLAQGFIQYKLPQDIGLLKRTKSLNLYSLEPTSITHRMFSGESLTHWLDQFPGSFARITQADISFSNAAKRFNSYFFLHFNESSIIGNSAFIDRHYYMVEGERQPEPQVRVKYKLDLVNSGKVLVEKSYEGPFASDLPAIFKTIVLTNEHRIFNCENSADLGKTAELHLVDETPVALRLSKHGHMFYESSIKPHYIWAGYFSTLNTFYGPPQVHFSFVGKILTFVDEQKNITDTYTCR